MNKNHKFDNELINFKITIQDLILLAISLFSFSIKKTGILFVSTIFFASTIKFSKGQILFFSPAPGAIPKYF